MKPKHLILSLLAMLVSMTSYADDYVVGQTFTVTQGMKVGSAWYSMKCKVINVKPNNVYEVSIYTEETFEWSGGGSVTLQVEIPQYVYYNGTSFIVTSVGSNDIPFFDTKFFYHIEKIVLPPTLERIGHENDGWGVFITNSSILPDSQTLTEVSGAQNLKTIGRFAFCGQRKLKTFPALVNVEEIGAKAFYNCDSIHTLNLANIRKLEQGAFMRCRGLTSVELGEHLEDSIPRYCFSGCEKLTSIKIPEGVYAIGQSAFSSCPIESFEIPASVNWIGMWAFSSSNVNLKRRFTVHATTPPTMVPVGNGNYNIHDNDTIYVPIGCSSAYLAAKGWQDGIIIEKDLRESQSIGLTTITPKTYGQANEYFEQKTKQGQVLNWTSSNTAVATFNGRIMSIKGAGTATITATAAGNNQYLPFSQTFTLTVNKATLTVTANNETIQQGEDLPSFSVSYSGFKYDDDESVLTNQPVITCNATSASSPGTYDINVSGASAKNYNISYVNGTLTITEATPITITANSYTRVYGDENPTFEFTVEGATLNGVPDISCAATPTSPVGTYPITITKGTVQNYNDTYVAGTLTITKAPLVITANDATIAEGSELPEFTASYSGFKNGETENVLTTQPIFSCSATSGSAVGTYPILVSGAAATNYEISYVPGTLTVTEDLSDTDISKMDNVIYIDRVEARAGATVTLSVKMKNSFIAEGFGFDLVLPEGIAVALDEYGFPIAELSTERTNSRITNHFDVDFKLDGSLNVQAYSSRGLTISGHDGEVALITIKVSEGLEAGEYPIILRNIAITDENSTTVTVDRVKFTLEVPSYIIGDANNDGNVNVGDLTAISHYILERPDASFLFQAADANQDGNVNVGDLTAVSHIILWGSIVRPQQAAPRKDSQSLDPQ